MHNAAAGMVQTIELAVRVLKVEPNRGPGRRRCAAYLGEFKFDAVRDVDSHAMLSSGGRALNGPPHRLQHAGNHDAAVTRIYVCLEFDSLEYRRMDRIRHRPVHPPMSG